MNFYYPVNKIISRAEINDGLNMSFKTYTNEEIMELLSSETTGHYLLGNHNFWHEGVHFTDKTVPQCVDKEPVRCIANGTIVAYRANDTYLKSFYRYGAKQNMSTVDDLTLQYSSSFCLVRHEYTSPKNSDMYVMEDSDPKKQWLNKTVKVVVERLATTEIYQAQDQPIQVTLPVGSYFTILAFHETNETMVKGRLLQEVSFTLDENADPDEGLPTNTTLAFGTEVWVEIFDTKDDIVQISKKLVIQEDTPPAYYLGNTLRLNTDLTATTLTRHDIVSLAIDGGRAIYKHFLKQANEEASIKPAEEYQYHYQAVLPKDMQVELVGYQGAIAHVRLSRPVNGTLTTSNTTASSISTEKIIAAGDIVQVELFDQQGKIKAISTSNKTSIAVETIAQSSWVNKLVILPHATQAYGTENQAYLLPESTKISIIEAQNTTGNPPSPLSQAILVNDTKVSALQLLPANTTVFLDIFDPYGNVKLQEDNQTPFIEQTDTAEPLHNTLTFYSLYMHLLLVGEYKTQIFPSYLKQLEIVRAKPGASGLEAWGEPSAEGVSQSVAVLNANAEFSYDGSTTKTITIIKGQQQMQLAMCLCTYLSDKPNFKDKRIVNKNDTFWAVIDKKISTLKIAPRNPLKVVECNLPIMAGEPIGYLGRHDTLKREEPFMCLASEPVNQSDPLHAMFHTPPQSTQLNTLLNTQQPTLRYNYSVSSKHQLHFETFVTDGLELTNFIKNKAQLKIGVTDYLVLPQGTLLQLTDPATNPSVEQIQTYRLRKKHAIELYKAKKYPPYDPKSTNHTNENKWYKVQITESQMVTDLEGQSHIGEEATITGYIAVDNTSIKIVDQNQWHELGFTIVSELQQNADGYISPTVIQSSETDNASLEPENVHLNNFFKDIFKEIDTNDNKRLTPEELQAALQKHDLFDRWSKIIGYHPTEWHAPSDDPKWSKLQDIIGYDEELLHHEKERIDQLIFWDQVPEIAASQQVYHFHPASFVYRMRANVVAQKNEKMCKIMANHTGYSRRASNPNGWGYRWATALLNNKPFNELGTKRPDTSLGLCYTYVKIGLLLSGLVSRYPWIEAAADTGGEMTKQGYINLQDNELMQLTNIRLAPKGAVIVYVGGQYGHVEVWTRGSFISDFMVPHARTMPRGSIDVTNLEGRDRKCVGIWIKPE